MTELPLWLFASLAEVLAVSVATFVLATAQWLLSPAGFGAAIRQGDAVLVQALIDRGARVNPLRVSRVPAQALGVPRARTPLELAIFFGNLKTVEVLLKAGARVHCLTSTNLLPMQLAFLHGRRDVGELLMAYGAVPLNSPDSVIDCPPWKGFSAPVDWSELDRDHRRDGITFGITIGLTPAGCYSPW